MSPPKLIKSANMEKLEQERMQQIENYLEQIGNFTTIQNQAMDLVLKAELEIHGVPSTPEGQQQLVDRCASMAALISKERLKRYNEGVRDVCVHKNVTELPEFVVWSAKRAGVDLFERPATPSEPPPSKAEAN